MFLHSKLNLTDIKSYQNVYKNVIVDMVSGVIFDESMQPIYETLYEILYWNPPIKGYILKNEELRKKEIENRFSGLKAKLSEIDSMDLEGCHEFNDDEEVIYMLHPLGWYPYGHLHDSLYRLYPWRNEVFKKPFVLCSRFNKVVDFHDHLKAAGYDASSIYSASNDKRFVKVSKLYFGVNPTHFYTNSLPDAYEWLLNGYFNLLQKDENPAPIQGLYLSRNSVVAGKRGVCNDQEISNFLSENGFMQLDGTESLRSMIDIFSRARSIVGPHGSIFVNTIFCGSDCKIMEYCPENRIDYSFKNKYKRATDYRHFLVPADSDFNIHINMAHLRKELER